MHRLLPPIVAAVAFASLAEPAAARDPGFDPRVITFGETREHLKSTPMVDRPNRPLHFYGNSVRRRHARGASRPPAQR